MVDRQQHWESVYRNKAADQVGWFQPHAASSLRLIEGCADKNAHIIDVGGGASVLVDDLLDTGYRHITVLDLAEPALAASRARLGARAASVQWIAADITRAELPAARYDVWHDRAVFHFLTDPADRARYVAQVLKSVKPGGHVIVAAFGPGGPLQCSGLDVVRYAAISERPETTSCCCNARDSTWCATPPTRCTPSSARPSGCLGMEPKSTTPRWARSRNLSTATACGPDHA